MAKLDEQISVLQERLVQLKLRQERSAARQRAIETQRERKTRLRRQVLIGDVVLRKLQSGEFDAALLRSWLDAALSRKSDRALFDLPPMGANPEPPEN